MDCTVKIEHLTKNFGSFCAVNDISLEVKKGEIFGFLGPNGAGKSTTIKILCGIMLPTSGTGSVGGFDITNEQNKIKSIIGYMSQKFTLYDDLTVSENLEFFGNIYSIEKKHLYHKIQEALSLSGLDGSRNVLVKKLPGGIKQRLALYSSILHEPQILFLDEPTSGVDPVMRRIFWDTIYRFADQGKTIFVTTHYMEEAEHCDRIALIISGRIIALDSPDALKSGLGFDVFLIKTSQPLKLLKKLPSLDFIADSAVFGDDIHLICKKNGSTAKKISSIMSDLRITDYKIKKIKPSLEDVFVVNAAKYQV